ncbi:MAG TPA: secretin N-terminal domain-containing protein, partial [Marinagarivorans sp.]
MRYTLIAVIGVLASCARINGELIAEREMRAVANAESQRQVITGDTSLPSAQAVYVKKVPAKRFNISVTNLPAKTFFLSLVSDAGVNVVTDPEVKGSISLELKNVTVEEVLNVTRDVYGYEYSNDGGVYIIYPRKLRTEIFDVDYLNISREGSTETSVAISAITSNDTTGTGNNSGGNNANSVSAGQNTSGTKIVTTSATDYWKNLEVTLNAIVGASEGRAVIVNPHASIIVVKALPKELSRVRHFLKRAQVNVTRQIILETKILEVTLSDGYEAGINWEQLGN